MSLQAVLAALLAAAAAVAATLGLHGTSHPAPTPAEIRLQTLTGVAKRLYVEEAHGSAARGAAHRIATDPRVIAAVRAHDPAALRAAALKELFNGTHIVRIHIRGGGIATDVGGAFVVSPRTTTVTTGGTTVTAVASIQDVAGYVKLIHRQTGLDAIVTDRRGQVYASFRPANVRLPDAGTAVLGGRPRLVESFTETGWNGAPLLVRVIGPA